jgi:hypothetical protein
VSARKRRRELAARNSSTRAAAHEHARRVALQIASGAGRGPAAYDVGVVLHEGERVLGRAPARFQTFADGSWIERGTPEWVITSDRLVGRLPTGELESIAWSAIAGLRVDLAQEWVALDAFNGWRAVLSGPAIAPIAVADVASCHGTQAMIEHPALAPLREPRPAPQTAVRTPAGAIENAVAQWELAIG